MMVRLDFGGRATAAARALRVRARAAPGVAIVAECGPHLPFRDSSIDELFVDRAIARRRDIAETLDELWRVSRPGALIHLRLPHASSIIAVSRDPHAQPLLTLDTFNYYDPRFSTAPAQSGTAFAIERARLHLAGPRGDDTGLALARGPLARFIEKLANGSRGSQYRFERWFSGLFGGFEEFSVVLSAVKPAARDRRPDIWAEPAAATDATSLHATSDVAHEAAIVDDDGAAVTPASDAPTMSSLPHPPFTSGTRGNGADA